MQIVFLLPVSNNAHQTIVRRVIDKISASQQNRKVTGSVVLLSGSSTKVSVVSKDLNIATQANELKDALKLQPSQFNVPLSSIKVRFSNYVVYLAFNFFKPNFKSTLNFGAAKVFVLYFAPSDNIDDQVAEINKLMTNNVQVIAISGTGNSNMLKKVLSPSARVIDTNSDEIADVIKC